MKNILNVNQPFCPQGKGKADRIIHNPVLLALRQHKGGIYGDRVTGMDAGALNMFHNSGNQDILPVADCIDLQLGPHQVFVDQDGIFYFVFKDNLHIFMDIRILIRYDHVLAAEYIAWTHQNGVSQPVCRRNCLILRINGIARGLFHIEFFQ